MEQYRNQAQREAEERRRTDRVVDEQRNQDIQDYLTQDIDAKVRKDVWDRYHKIDEKTGKEKRKWGTTISDFLFGALSGAAGTNRPSFEDTRRQQLMEEYKVKAPNLRNEQTLLARAEIERAKNETAEEKMRMGNYMQMQQLAIRAKDAATREKAQATAAELAAGRISNLEAQTKLKEIEAEIKQHEARGVLASDPALWASGGANRQSAGQFASPLGQQAWQLQQAAKNAGSKPQSLGTISGELPSGARMSQRIYGPGGNAGIPDVSDIFNRARANQGAPPPQTLPQPGAQPVQPTTTFQPTGAQPKPQALDSTVGPAVALGLTDESATFGKSPSQKAILQMNKWPEQSPAESDIQWATRVFKPETYKGAYGGGLSNRLLREKYRLADSSARQVRQTTIQTVSDYINGTLDPAPWTRSDFFQKFTAMFPETAQTVAKTFGTRASTPEEYARLKEEAFNNFRTVFGDLKANVSGRFMQAEIEPEMQVQGTPAQQAENLLRLRVKIGMMRELTALGDVPMGHEMQNKLFDRLKLETQNYLNQVKAFKAAAQKGQNVPTPMPPSALRIYRSMFRPQDLIRTQ